ncbi:hypothetical protein WN943_006859 [Citrus x changshan-huyou]
MAGGGGGDEEPSLQNVETKPHNHTCGSSQMPNPKREDSQSNPKNKRYLMGSGISDSNAYTYDDDGADIFGLKKAKSDDVPGSFVSPPKKSD